MTALSSALDPTPFANLNISSTLARISDEQIRLIEKRIKAILKKGLPSLDLVTKPSGGKIIRSSYSVKVLVPEETPFFSALKKCFRKDENESFTKGSSLRYSLKDLIAHIIKQRPNFAQNTEQLKDNSYSVEFSLDLKASKELQGDGLVFRVVEKNEQWQTSETTFSLAEIRSEARMLKEKTELSS